MRTRQSRTFVALFLLLLQLSAHAAKKHVRQKPLSASIQEIIDQPLLSHAFWGIDVLDLKTGRTIYALNADNLFLPASNAKLFTTAAVLAIAGPDYRFHTTVGPTTPVDSNGHLAGDLVIFGRGDPNISGRVLPYALKTQRVPPHTQVLEELADQVAHTGLKDVEGDVIGDDTFYAPERYAEGWEQDDLQWTDAAPVSALTFNDNQLFINVLPGPSVGDKALVSMEPENSYYELDNRVVTTAAAGAKKIGVHRDMGSRRVVLWGTVPIGDPGVKEAISVEDPAEFVAQLFRAMLEKRGITIHGTSRARHAEIAQFFDQPLTAQVPGKPAMCCMPAQPSPTPLPENNTAASPATLAEHVSLPLLEDVRVINKTSQNLHAELALRLAGKLSGAGASFEGGTAALKQFLLQAGLKEDEFFFLDGSGLSRRDLVTPAALVQLLVYAARQPWGAAYEESLPVAGVDGSLAERFLNTPAGGLVHAKTGTLGHVNSLSGYGESQKGRQFAFSIFCNNHNLPATRVQATIDSIVELLVEEVDRGGK